MMVNRIIVVFVWWWCVKVGFGVGFGVMFFVVQVVVVQGDMFVLGVDVVGSVMLFVIMVSGECGYLLCVCEVLVVGFDDVLLCDMLVLVNVIMCVLIDDQQVKWLSDVVCNDVLVVNDYVLVGYFEGFVICGFLVDFVSVIWIDGLMVFGEQNVLFENKECVEILKGFVGIDSGVVVLGGVINFVIKCFVNVVSVMGGVDSCGLMLVVVDFGWCFGFDYQFGFWINVVKENMYFYIDGMNG